MDVDALKNVLANLDLVALLLRTRPPLSAKPKAMREELRAILTASGMFRFSNRELGVLCNLLVLQQQQKSRAARAEQAGLAVLGGL